MQIEPISPSIGAIIREINISEPVGPDLLAELRAIWLDRKVVIIRGQHLSSEQYIAFARQLGTPDIYPFLKGLDGFPEITPVLKRDRDCEFWRCLAF